jgi:hypothetical protein
MGLAPLPSPAQSAGLEQSTLLLPSDLRLTPEQDSCGEDFCKVATLKVHSRQLAGNSRAADAEQCKGSRKNELDPPVGDAIVNILSVISNSHARF